MKTKRELIIEEKLKQERLRQGKMRQERIRQNSRPKNTKKAPASTPDQEQKKLLIGMIKNANKTRQQAIIQERCRSQGQIEESYPATPPPPQPMSIQPFEPMTGTFKHSGDLGDLWYSLPVIKYLGGGGIYLNHRGLSTKKIDGTDSGFTKTLINLCIPLLEAQPYINSVKFWDKESVKVDIDEFRRFIHIKDGNLCKSILYSFSVPMSELNEAWITCGKRTLAPTVFARSGRFQNPAIVEKLKTLLKQNRDSVFVGLPDEHRKFQREIGRIHYQPIRDFLELAEIINGSELFIGNQSSPMALAIGLNKPFVQEVCSYCSDCKFHDHRSNGQYLI